MRYLSIVVEKLESRKQVNLKNYGEFLRHIKNGVLVSCALHTRAEVEQLVTEYVDFYNFERISLKNGLTPVEIRSKTA